MREGHRRGAASGSPAPRLRELPMRSGTRLQRAGGGFQGGVCRCK